MHYKFLHGFSLIEVLISLLLLSLILLIFNAHGWYVLQEARANYYFHVASCQFKNMAERLRALNQHKGFDDQIEFWQQEIQQLLPLGHGSVSGQYPHYVITVSWGKKTESCTQNQIGIDGCLKESVFI